MMGYTELIFNFIIYLLLFVFYQIYKRRFDIGSIIILIYLISNLSSLYYFNNANIDCSNYSIFPSLYLFVCFFISIYPLLRYNWDIKIKLRYAKETKYFLNVASIIAALFAITPFVEFCFQMKDISTSLGANSLGARYDDESLVMPLSYVSRKFYYILYLFKYVLPFLLIYQLSLCEKRKFLILGLILAILDMFLGSFLISSRTAIVSYLLYLLISYSVFSNVLSETLRKVINFASLSAFGIIFFLIAIITIARFNYSIDGEFADSDNPMLTWVSLYLGESNLRFNTQMFHTIISTNGDVCFSLLKQSLGLDTFPVLAERQVHYLGLMHIPQNVFYTYIGDLYSDLGPLGTLLFLFFLSFVVSYCLKKRHQGNIDIMIILSLVILIYAYGFTHYVYTVYSLQWGLLFPLLFASLLFFTRTKIKKNI